jgi:hypothetical protein
MAGGKGFEPLNARTKTWCLTTWPTPNIVAGERCNFSARWSFFQSEFAFFAKGIVAITICVVQ